jgi:eukaryotic-like serine/threonine-protein kinase
VTAPPVGLTTALADRYRLERELGGGGMSRVWLATETALGREVVIKVIATELAEGLSAERFAREVRLAARLQHANIVPVLAAGDAGGLPFYTMPYVRGESLRARIASGTTVPLAECVSILRDVARALACAHGEVIVHRDIKPDNVLLSHGAAMVTDFGIARAVSASRTSDGSATVEGLTVVGSVVGTPAYMAPEQAAGDEVDHRADIYAWGMLAWELLSGRHPFAGKKTPRELVVAHMTVTPEPLAALRPDAPQPLASLVMRCLEKDPALRPQDASELLGTLDSVAPPRARLPGRRNRPQPPGERHRHD